MSYQEAYYFNKKSKEKALKEMEENRKGMVKEMQAYQDEIQAANRQVSGQTSREANDG